MVSGKAMVAAGAVAFAAGAAVSWTATRSGANDVVEGEVAAQKPVASSVDRAPAKRAARPGGDRPPSPDSPPEPARAGALDDLAPTESEREWLREALVAERLRRENSLIRPEDGGTEILERWLRNGADVAQVLTDYATAAAHVREATASPHEIVSTGETTAADPPADATVLQFGAGRFTLGPQWRSWSNRRKDAESIEIRGAGADRTTIVANSDLLFCWEAATLRHVRIRDLTIESVDSLIDARGAVSVALEGVRIVGWQSGGHSSPIGVSGRAFLAFRDCEFVGGDGIGVVSLRGPGAVVFEKCTFLDVQSTVLGGGAASGGRPSVVRFLDCRFENARVADSRIRQGRDVEVDLRVRGGSVSPLGAKATEDERRKTWGAEYAAEVSGVTFGASRPRFTVGDVLRALEFAAAAGIRDIVGFDVASSPRGTAPAVDIYFLDAKGAVTRTTRRLLPSGLGEPEESRHGMRGFHTITPAELSAALPLAELIRRAGFEDGEGLTNAQYAVGQVQTAADTAPRTALLVQFESQDRRAPMLDARTGEPFGR